MCTFIHIFKFTLPKLFYVAYNKGFILNKIKKMDSQGHEKDEYTNHELNLGLLIKIWKQERKNPSWSPFLMPFYSGNQQLFLYLQFYIIKIK